MDDPWDETADDNRALHDIEWTRMSSDFTNVGYREGITAGKEAASQEGFDAGFARVGVPLGRDLGVLRGVASALLALLKTAPPGGGEALMLEAEAIGALLARVRFSDIAPRDLEAEAHAREHLEAEGEALVLDEGLAARREMEGIEDMLAGMSAGGGGGGASGNGNGRGAAARPTMDDLRAAKERLAVLSGQLGLAIEWDK